MSDDPRRVGDTVRRPVRSNTVLVLGVLRRLEAAGATWAPRSRGVDEGFEVLSWLDGDTPADGTEIDLYALIPMVRELHDLTAPLAAGSADGAECLIHDDLQPRNVVVQDGRPVGLIDWEQARLGRRVEDVADLCWSFVEPRPGSDAREIGRRWREVLVTYGLDRPEERAVVVATVLARMTACIDDIERNAAAGSARHQVLAGRGDHLALGAMLDWTTANQEVLQLMLEDDTTDRYRIIDTAGSEVAIVSLDEPALDEGAAIELPGLGLVTVVEIYDDEDGREGGVVATIVIEEP